MIQTIRPGRPRAPPSLAVALLTLASLVLASLLGLACGPGYDAEQGAQGEPSKVTVLYCCDERVLGPFYQMPAQLLVFLPLFGRSEEGEIQGKLVSRWESSPDYRTWTYHLRPGLRWHDGVSVTAHDVKFTFDLLTHPEVLYEPPGVRIVTVLDDSTFSISYQQPADPYDTYSIYLPRHRLKDLDPAEFGSWDFWTHPVGNGPYRHVRTVPKTMVELEANPDHYPRKPDIERVVLRFGGGLNAYAEALSGNVDILAWGAVGRDVAMRLAADPRFRVYESPGGATTALYWNHRHPFFGDPGVRRALALAVDRRELARILGYSDDVALYDVWVGEEQRRGGEAPEPLPHDAELAMTLLEEAGWRDAEGDGTRERSGEAFRFTAMLESSSRQHATLVQAQLREIGVRMELRYAAFDQVRDAIEAGDFEAAFYHFREAELTRYLSENSLLGYENRELARLLREAATTFDPGEKDRIHREVWDIFQRDLPVLILVPNVATSVAHRRVRGLSSPNRAFPVWHMDELWIEEEG